MNIIKVSSFDDLKTTLLIPASHPPNIYLLGPCVHEIVLGSSSTLLPVLLLLLHDKDGDLLPLLVLLHLSPGSQLPLLVHPEPVGEAARSYLKYCRLELDMTKRKLPFIFDLVPDFPSVHTSLTCRATLQTP